MAKIKFIWFLAFWGAFGFFPWQIALAEAGEGGDGAVICQPGVYLQAPDDCLALGPSAVLTDLARQGYAYPPLPLPAAKPEDALNAVPYLYYKITEPYTNTYGSLQAAMEKNGALRQIGPGEFMYVTYIGVEETQRGTYFLLPSGEWMPGDGSRVSVPVFQGLEFFATPKNAFGWVIFGAEVRPTPGYGANVPALRSLPKYSIVQVYETLLVEGEEWYLIGPGEWMEGRQVAVVTPAGSPPTGVSNGRWIDVNLAEQTMAVYDQNELVFATVIASGIEPYWTRPGLFQIYKMKETEDMSGSFEADRSDFYYLERVPWTMYFDKARAIHGAYWRYGLGYPQSHGCVNMSVGDSAWLFRWAKEGDWVHVYDPSGLTPDDPALYSDGGA